MEYMQGLQVWKRLSKYVSHYRSLFMKEIWTKSNGTKRLTLIGENYHENIYLAEAGIINIMDEFGVMVGMELVVQESDEPTEIKTFAVDKRDMSGFATIGRQERIG